MPIKKSIDTHLLPFPFLSSLAPFAPHQHAPPGQLLEVLAHGVVVVVGEERAAAAAAEKRRRKREGEREKRLSLSLKAEGE